MIVENLPAFSVLDYGCAVLQSVLRLGTGTPQVYNHAVRKIGL